MDRRLMYIASVEVLGIGTGKYSVFRWTNKRSSILYLF